MGLRIGKQKKNTIFAEIFYTTITSIDYGKSV
jgi:hypothetical protein